MEVFTNNYYKLAHLNFKALGPHLVTARVINHEDDYIIQQTIEPSKVAAHVLEIISASLQGGTDAMFDKFLSVLENHNDLFCTPLAEEMRRELSMSATGKVCTK